MKNKLITKKIISYTGLVLFSLPLLTFAADSATVASGVAKGITYECTGGAPGVCTFADVIAAIQLVLKWGTTFAVAFSVVVIAWAGFIYMTSGGNSGKRAEANTMLMKVAIGIAFMFMAWLIVTLIMNALGVTGAAKSIF